MRLKHGRNVEFPTLYQRKPYLTEAQSKGL